MERMGTPKRASFFLIQTNSFKSPNRVPPDREILQCISPTTNFNQLLLIPQTIRLAHHHLPSNHFVVFAILVKRNLSLHECCPTAGVPAIRKVPVRYLIYWTAALTVEIACFENICWWVLWRVASWRILDFRLICLEMSGWLIISRAKRGLRRWYLY